VEYAGGGGLYIGSLSHCWSSDLDQEEYSDALLVREVSIWGRLKGRSEPNRKRYPETDKHEEKRDGTHSV